MFVKKLIQTLEHEECNKSPVWDEKIAAFSSFIINTILMNIYISDFF